MKIRLTVDLPIEPKHGAKKGSEFTVARVHHHGRTLKYFFKGVAGEECAALAGEFEITKATPAPKETHEPEKRDAYAEGVDAALGGASETTNPFPHGTDDHLSWNDGFMSVSSGEDEE